jgi:hypothetical protein
MANLNYKILFMKILFSLGLLLTLVNFTGLFISLRNPDIYKEKRCLFYPNDITLAEEEVYQKINVPVNDRKTYVRILNDAVNQGMAHYWEDEGIDKYNLRIPPHNNYLLFLLSYVQPSSFMKYEFVNYKRGINRGVGLCSQKVIIESAILAEKGIPSEIISLSEHIVLQAQVDVGNDEWWVLGPDYGVIIPYSIYDIEKNPEIIRPYFLKGGYNESTINMLTRVYSNKPQIYKGIKEYSPKRYYFEDLLYLLKWIIPFILMIIPVIMLRNKRRNHISSN